MKRSIIQIAGTALVSILAPAAMAAIHPVTTTADTGAGSLRNAINLANNDASLSAVEIHFAITGPLTPSGVAVIQPLTPLPVIQNMHGKGIKIDGYTQPGSSYVAFNPTSLVVKVELDGSALPATGSAPPFSHGLHIMSSNNIVQGLCVHSFPHDGISIQGIPPNTFGHPGSNANYIQWNLVGTDVDGMVAMPNGHDTGWPGSLWGGIYIKVLPGMPGHANDNVVLENVSSGNAVEGVGIANCPDEGSEVKRNHVERCLLGIDITGVAPLGNGHTGCYIGEGAQDNVVEQNWIGTNGFSGVSIVGLIDPPIFTDGNEVSRNKIGVDMAFNPMGNALHGVAIGSYGDSSVSHHYVGGHARTNKVEDNIIAYNSRTGVTVQEGQGQVDNASYNTITANQIKFNGYADPGYIGIDLVFEPGVTFNDGGDLDSGPNRLVNFPANMTAVYAGGTTTVAGTLDALGLPATVEIFQAIPDSSGSNHGQGAVYLGSVSPAGASWSTSPPHISGALPGQLLTATATDSFGNTSEFALNVPVVEDNQGEYDFGDAPDSYQTKLASGGAYHTIVAGMYLGNSIDSEPDGQPNASATGDDLDGNNDEQGVAFPVLLIPGQSCQIDVTASQVGWIEAWIDFDGNGSWSGGEQILPNAVPGETGSHPGLHLTKSYSFTVPSGAVTGQTFARVRYSSGGGLLPTGGPAQDGEVEDYQVDIEENQGAIGDFVWDDVNGNGIQDLTESGLAGVTVHLLDAASSVIATTVTGGLGDYLFGGLAAGTYEVEFVLPPGKVFTPANQGGDDTLDSDADPVSGRTGLITLSPGGVDLTWDAGMSDDPSVEFDWGDAPDDSSNPNDYPTLSASGGAYHAFVAGVYLGGGVDPEPDGQPHPHAVGDDNSILYGGFDDEDGVAFTSPLVPGAPVTLHVQASVAGHLNAWVDMNGDGDWQHPSEQVFTDQALVPGSNPLSFMLPAGSMIGTSYVRFRFTSAAGLNLSPGGGAPDGEVEDYIIEIEDGEIPHKMHWAQLPDPTGWDVRGWAPKILADDFRCTANGPITRITFWGSWLDDVIGELTHVHLSIHADDRTGEYSKPVNPHLWEWNVAGDAVTTEWEGEGPQGWIDPNTGVVLEPPNHHNYYRHTIDIPADQAFWQEEGTIYWLDIQVECQGGQWGWKTSRSAHFEDDAVWGDWVPGTGVDPAWQELIDPYTELSLDFAFVIDGEEEPQDLDFGDAPEVPQVYFYPTTLGNSGARHVIVPGYHMGGAIDPEPDGQPTPPALGDDLAGSPNDEDGVFFYPMVPGLNSAMNVTLPASAGAGGMIDAWIDFDQDGNWGGAGEQIASSYPVSVGVNPISFFVPPGMGPGTTYARVRFSSAGGLPDFGPAPDGEVEDYEVKILPENSEVYDYGDAPDGPYPTLNMSSGAAHVVGGSLFLGTVPPDGEPDGQPDANAQGDDLDLVFPPANDDEDGVIFPYALFSGKSTTIRIEASAPGFVDLWVDTNNSGVWGDFGDVVLTAHPVTAGMNYVSVTAPAGSVGPTFARVRISSTGFLPPTGFAADGEVEDYLVDVYDESQEMDFGDAPNLTLGGPWSFPTTMMDFGAAHLIDSLFLGWLIDGELDGVPTVKADGDDLAGLSDEDGISFDTAWISGSTAHMTVTVNPAVIVSGELDLWADWDGNGTWTPATEHVIGSAGPVMVNQGQNPITIMVPAGLGPVKTYARFRLTHPGTGPGIGGFVHGGEVEDYEVPIGKRINSAISVSNPPLTIMLTWVADPAATFYHVYSSTTLSAPFPVGWTVETPVGGTPGLSWTDLPGVPAKFYIVVAFP